MRRGAAVDADLALGRHAELVGELERLVADDPLRERLRGQLMLALYRSGRQAEALATYQDARRTLSTSSGSSRAGAAGARAGDPQPGSRSSTRRTDRPADGGDIRAARGGRLRRTRARAGEILAGVLATRARAAAGSCSSRASPESARADSPTSSRPTPRPRGATVLWGRCWEAGGAPAYWPWVQALRTYVRDRDTRRAPAARCRSARPRTPPPRRCETCSPTLRSPTPGVGGRALPPVRRGRDVPAERVRRGAARPRARRPPRRRRAIASHVPVRRGRNRRRPASRCSRSTVTPTGPDGGRTSDSRISAVRPASGSRSAASGRRRSSYVRSTATSSRRPRSSTRSYGAPRATLSSSARLSGSSWRRASSIGPYMRRRGSPSHGVYETSSAVASATSRRSASRRSRSLPYWAGSSDSTRSSCWADARRRAARCPRPGCGSACRRRGAGHVAATAVRACAHPRHACTTA